MGVLSFIFTFQIKSLINKRSFMWLLLFLCCYFVVCRVRRKLEKALSFLFSFKSFRSVLKPVSSGVRIKIRYIEYQTEAKYILVFYTLRYGFNRRLTEEMMLTIAWWVRYCFDLIQVWEYRDIICSYVIIFIIKCYRAGNLTLTSFKTKITIKVVL